MFSLFEEIERGGGKIADNPNIIKVKSKIGLKHEFIKYIVSDASTDDDVHLYYQLETFNLDSIMIYS